MKYLRMAESVSLGDWIAIFRTTLYFPTRALDILHGTRVQKLAVFSQCLAVLLQVLLRNRGLVSSSLPTRFEKMHINKAAGKPLSLRVTWSRETNANKQQSQHQECSLYHMKSITFRGIMNGCKMMYHAPVTTSGNC